MIIKLIRHGQSKKNVDSNSKINDTTVLTKEGQKQARQVGKTIGEEFVGQAIIYTSPYLCARQTTYHLVDESNAIHKFQVPRIYEDPRLREAEFDTNEQEIRIRADKGIQDKQGYFYCRYGSNESPANVYDRVSTFIDNMMRQSNHKKSSRIIIVSHGITIRCFVMRFMKLTVEQFNVIDNPKHCDIVTLTTHMPHLSSPQFVSGKWGVCGLHKNTVAE